LYKVDYQNSPPLILKLLTGDLLLGALKAGPLTLTLLDLDLLGLVTAS
jgi:hypothetical protein